MDRGKAIPDHILWWGDEYGIYAAITDEERQAAQAELDSQPQWFYVLFTKNWDCLLPLVSMGLVALLAWMLWVNASA